MIKTFEKVTQFVQKIKINKNPRSATLFPYKSISHVDRKSNFQFSDCILTRKPLVNIKI
jgi:hypothetical protein